MKASVLRRAAVVALGVCAGVGAVAPQVHAHEGFYVSLGLGTATFTGDEVIVAGAIPVPLVFGRTTVNRTSSFSSKKAAPTGFGGLLRLGYNIGGFAGVELNVLAHEWDLFKDARGGGGFVGGAVRLHPIEYLARLTPKILRAPQRAWDVSVPLGGGYTLVGQNNDRAANQLGFAYDGNYFQSGVLFEYYPLSNGSRSLALGLDLNVFVPFYKDRLFIDYGESQYVQIDAPSTIAFCPMFTIAGHFVPDPAPSAETAAAP